MSFSFIPLYAFQKVTDISAGFLRSLGVKFLMIDLDNTIAAYGECYPADEVTLWITEMKSSGFELYIVSNSRLKKRVEAFAEAFGIKFVKSALKPSPKGLIKAMDLAGFSPGESALVGDQIFTDTIAANLAGAVSIIVRPRKCGNLLLLLRYAVEAPFRVACKNKM